METYKNYLPKYIQIKDLIKTRIKTGYYKHGQKLQSRAALAKEFSTTLSTCSKAVDELLEEKELETQIGIGTFIAGLNIEKKCQIYGIVRTLNNPFYGKFAESLSKMIKEKNFLPPKIISIQYDLEKEAETVKTLLKENNSIIVMCGFLSPLTRELILAHPERFYIFGRPESELQEKVNQISTDTEKGAFIIVNHLIEMGHRNIAIITAPLKPDLKIDGYRKALVNADIKINEKYIANVSPATDRLPSETLNIEMNSIIDDFLKCHQMPTAVFCISDFVAVNFISACQMRGLRIPDAFSVCGYDGAFEGHTGAYQITTVAQSLDELFHEVLNHLSSGKYEPFMNLQLPPTLRIGNTVRNLKEGR